jgi:hypothetical protein
MVMHQALEAARAAALEEALAKAQADAAATNDEATRELQAEHASTVAEHEATVAEHAAAAAELRASLAAAKMGSAELAETLEVRS